MNLAAFRNQIENIIADNRSGSITLLNKTIDATRNYLKVEPEVDREEMVALLNKLYFSHSGMLVIFHFINELFNKIQDLHSGQEAEGAFNRALLDLIDNYRGKWNNGTEKIAESLMNNIDLNGKCILLHSNSHTIVGVFDQMGKKGIFPRVIKTASGPINEGRVQAAKLDEKGFDVTFINDAAVAGYIKEIDMAIFGSDGVFDDFFLNKTGTYMYSMLFEHYRKPVYVVSDGRKIVNREKIPEFIFQRFLKEDPKPREELWIDSPANIRIPNYYFEKIPNNMVAGFVLESGIFPHYQLKRPVKDFQISELFNFDISENVD